MQYRPSLQKSAATPYPCTGKAANFAALLAVDVPNASFGVAWRPSGSHCSKTRGPCGKTENTKRAGGGVYLNLQKIKWN